MADAFATITQRRMTGGFRIDGIDGKNLHLDPGPGALVRSYQFGVNPLKLHGILVSHSHTDHYSDAEVLIEAMTRGMTRKKGLVIGSESVINGYQKWGPCISHYHLSRPQVEVMDAGDHFRMGDIKITATPTQHGDPKNIGFRLEWEDFTLSYTSDTAYFEELHQHHQNADVLIASVIRPGNERIRGHLCADEFQQLVDETSPKLTIMTHLGMKLITDHPVEEADKITDKTGVKTIAAHDGMVIDLDQFHSKQQTLDEY
ncbi:MBL fold metallo-hydrolase [Methanobacterium sp. MZ-A1]|uniref:MBL fold metallo-hydrolase n=1 Tax=Methanobacterium subterraneum TaxID=59277 RepID=A0A2H4VFH1_9EURY|nr:MULTISPECIES: MBL fold metallo-hydrolase [Methanobacterium]AUB56833.1 MBL fold metallo-hydrolase [Methanobacterium subterraneum]AUB59172.1 MBL fold metallo-hydrolase [Methanobacterium sp. MZ-A1]AUB61411.1 MBL fold metallo-hydrolase [Methanobacterium subterraneum]PKL73788.1 MAG: MBL fold metallo-hydrolase [Methanobacteriales archaeon HGW-Methanobacteriales-2]